MDDHQSVRVLDENFYSSNKSPIAKFRLWMWFGSLIALAIVVFSSQGSFKQIFLAVLILGPIYALVDWSLRRQLNKGKVLVALSDEAIASPNLTGERKRYLWSEISKVSVEAVQNHAYLQLHLFGEGKKNGVGFFLSQLSKASIPLGLFSQEDQALLIESVERRIQNTCAIQGRDSQPLINNIEIDQEFQGRLQAQVPNTWVTYCLIGINVSIWIVSAWLSASLFQKSIDSLISWGGNIAFDVQHGEWWRLLTAAFLHSGIWHLTINMVALYFIGRQLERVYGHRLFTLIYFSSALMGSALSLHFSAQNSVSVGASGAILGLAAALLITVLRNKKILPKIFWNESLASVGFFIVYSLFQGFVIKENVDNAAHIGGFFAGSLLA